MACVVLDAIDVLLIARLAADFPLSRRPYADVARELALDEAQVLARLRRLHAAGVISAPTPQPARCDAARVSALVGAEVPADCIDDIVARAGALPEVVHAEQRRHRVNLWFALAAASAAALDIACTRLEAVVGRPLLVLPHESTYVGALLWLA